MFEKQNRSFKESSMGNPGGKKGVDAVNAKGDKGIPPGMPGSKAWSGKGVQSSTNQGDKGVPPMGGGGEGRKAPLD